MMKTGGILLPLALSGLLGLSLTGCAGQDKAGTPAAKAPADPKAALAGSVAAVKDGNYAFAVKAPNVQGSGVIHLPSKSATVTYESTAADGEGTFEIRYVEPDRWTKATVAGMAPELSGADLNDPQMKDLKQLAEMFSGKYWLHQDTSTTKNAATKGIAVDFADPDVTGISDFIGAVSAAQGDAHTITGTIDGTKITDDGFLSADDIKAAGAAASAMPFSAALDDQGRLSTLEMDVPKMGETPAGKWTVQISGYGEQKPQEKPTGDIKEMTPEAAAMVNG